MEYVLRISSSAKEDLAGILSWSQAAFGEQAQLRYRALIQAGLRDVRDAYRDHACLWQFQRRCRSVIPH